MAAINTLSDEVPADSLADHLGTYGGFLHLIRWVALHLLIDVTGIIVIIEGNPALGLCLIACGTAVLIWTIVTTRRATAASRAQATPPANESA